LLHLVGYLYYWQMGFNSVFKGLIQLLKLKIVPCGTATCRLSTFNNSQVAFSVHSTINVK